MCGRFTRLYSWKQLHRLLSLTAAPLFELAPSYNVAPSQQSYVCRLSANGERELVAMRWGFTPAWSKDGKPGPANARGESVATNGMFRAAFKSRRCIVPISGFFEWQRIGTSHAKQPYYIHPLNDDPLLLAGIWESWGDQTQSIESFSIITTAPNTTIAAIHDRMPVVIDQRLAELWLSPSTTPAKLLALLRPTPDGTLNVRRVSPRVNKPQNDDPSLISEDGVDERGRQSSLFEG